MVRAYCKQKLKKNQNNYFHLFKAMGFLKIKVTTG